jgi:tetratricopeptide (TPR) repeat protein
MERNSGRIWRRVQLKTIFLSSARLRPMLHCMSDMIDLVDENGKQIQMPREAYAAQVVTFARQHWDNLETLRHLIMQMVQVGLYAEALELVQRACELSNDSVHDMYWRAACRAEAGYHEEAAREFAEIQEDAAYPQDQARAAIGLARMKAKLGKHDEVEDLLNWAMDADPTGPAPLHSYYGFCAERGDAEKGLEKILQIARENPQNSAPYRVLAQISASKQDSEGVKENARRAAELASPEESDQVLADMSYLLGISGNPQEIVDLIEPRRLKVSNPQIFMNLVQAYVDLNRNEDARALLQQLISGAPPQVRSVLEAKLHEIA